MYYKVDFDKFKDDFDKYKRERPETRYVYSDDIYLKKIENSVNEAIKKASNENFISDQQIIFSINKQYFKPLYEVKIACDNIINSLVEEFSNHYKINKDLWFYTCPEFKLYYIISENLSLSYDFLKNIDNFYLYNLEFSTIRFYLRQSIEAFVNMYNLVQEAMITKTISCATNYFKLCSLYSKSKKDTVLETFKEDLKKSYFYTHNKHFKKLIFDENLEDESEDEIENKKSFIPVSSVFFVATFEIHKKFKKELDCIKKENYKLYETLIILDKLYTLIINELKDFYSYESEFVHVDINNEDLFNYNTFNKKDYFDNLNYELEELFFVFYIILYYTSYLIELYFSSRVEEFNLNVEEFDKDNHIINIINNNRHYTDNENVFLNKNKPLNFSVILDNLDNIDI